MEGSGVVCHQNADIADILQLKGVAIATILAFYIWGTHWRQLTNTTEVPYAAAMRPYDNLL